MTTPLTASLRIQLTYVQNGFTHKIRAYCKSSDIIGIGMTIDYRDASAIQWYDAAEGFAVALKPFMGGTMGPAELQYLSGGIWTFVDVTSIAATATGTTANAHQTTLTLRDTGGHKMKVVIMESGLPVLPSHYATEAGAVAAVAAVKNWLAYGIAVDDPYNWQVSRDEEYISVAGFVGITSTLNTKMRRARGLV